MVKLEDLKEDIQIHGIVPDEIVTIIQAKQLGSDAVTVYYKDSQGKTGERMLFASDEPQLKQAVVGRPWAFDASGDDFRLAVEAWRISQAALFDPMIAVHTSNIEPLPHQISAVYEAMLPRQPLRFVLADDPGAGKTIMAGLLIQELLLRADVRRVLIVSPGGLTEQWQDELLEKFDLSFEIFSREKQEQSASGNFFTETSLLIARLDQLSRNEDFQEKLKSTQWDLIIVDEAHKLSANCFGNKINKTKRFQLGELLGSITRHFLLMTATPHNGKDEDFHVWLSMLDKERFYGKPGKGAKKPDVSDIMRRMIKEELVKFDGTRLFPERKAYTLNYQLSDMESLLYKQVTTYVRDEMNRADKLDNKKKNSVGFALTILQRRLASSPEAIYQSLKRRRERLEARLKEIKLLARGEQFIPETTYKADIPENFDELDEELSGAEYEKQVDEIMDQATASETIPELTAEIESLEILERQARKVVSSGQDKKWEELSELLQNHPKMCSAHGKRYKLIIFTEHKDTLNYLKERITGMWGRPHAIRTISGSTGRDERRKTQEEFRNDPEVLFLIATDAAGEGVNLQNANLMVNYDLPWNPNRLEQRFGRIHRIGQTEVCHLWNLVAKETREGQVFQKLFDKIEAVRATLGGKVFDVLGEAFEEKPLKDLLIEAIRYSEDPQTKAEMDKVIEVAMDTDHLQEVLRRNALTDHQMKPEDIYKIKEEMDKAEARKLQPYFIRSFFSEAFKSLQGEMRNREPGRYEVPRVPATIREWDRAKGESRTPVLKKYERICFKKEDIRISGKPMADFIHPRHPLMHATTALVLKKLRNTLKEGTILIDPHDHSLQPKILFMLKHAVKEAGHDGLTASCRAQFIKIDEQGQAFDAGPAPHLDLQPFDESDRKLFENILDAP